MPKIGTSQTIPTSEPMPPDCGLKNFGFQCCSSPTSRMMVITSVITAGIAISFPVLTRPSEVSADMVFLPSHKDSPTTIAAGAPCTRQMILPAQLRCLRAVRSLRVPPWYCDKMPPPQGQQWCGRCTNDRSGRGWAFPSLDFNVRLGLYLPGIRAAHGFRVIVRITHKDDDRVHADLPAQEFPLALLEAMGHAEDDSTLSDLPV